MTLSRSDLRVGDTLGFQVPCSNGTSWFTVKAKITSLPLDDRSRGICRSSLLYTDYFFTVRNGAIQAGAHYNAMFSAQRILTIEEEAILKLGW